MLPYSTPADYTPLPPPGEDPIVLGHKALLASLDAQMAKLDEQVAAYQRLAKQCEITRPPWWDQPDHPLLARTPRRSKAGKTRRPLCTA